MTKQTASPVSVSGFIVRPHHTALCVDDFEASRDFFTDVIGMKVEGETDNRDEENLGKVVGEPGAVVRWAMLELSGYRLELFKYYTPAGHRQEIRQCDIGLTHICFEVYDVEAVYARLSQAGHKTISPPLELRGGRTKPFYLYGPENIVVEFLELRP